MKISGRRDLHSIVVKKIPIQILKLFPALKEIRHSSSEVVTVNLTAYEPNGIKIE
jgi:hypothetical protein